MTGRRLLDLDHDDETSARIETNSEGGKLTIRNELRAAPDVVLGSDGLVLRDGAGKVLRRSADSLLSSGSSTSNEPSCLAGRQRDPPEPVAADLARQVPPAGGLDRDAELARGDAPEARRSGCVRPIPLVRDLPAEELVQPVPDPAQLVRVRVRLGLGAARRIGPKAAWCRDRRTSGTYRRSSWITCSVNSPACTSTSCSGTGA